MGRLINRMKFCRYLFLEQGPKDDNSFISSYFYGRNTDIEEVRYISLQLYRYESSEILYY